MQDSLILSLKPSISIIEEAGQEVQLQVNNETLTLKELSPGLLAAIKILCSNGATEEALENLVLNHDGASVLPKLYYYLEQFLNLSIICHTVESNGAPLAKIVPNCPLYQFQFQQVALDKQYLLSRFAYGHREEDQNVLESPLSYAKIILLSWQSSALIAELSQPSTCNELSKKIPGISEETAQDFLSLLLTAQMLVEAEDNQEEKSTALTQWEFHDLLFHARNRTGRHSNPAGRTYRFLNKTEPLPVIKPKVSDEIINLYKPDLKQLEKTDPPLTKVIESRRSIRDFGKQPLTAKQLGEFLYRSVRVREILKKEIEETSNRPYPNGGAAYELEFYLITNNCQDIPVGFYHYDPQDHQLCKISNHNEKVEALLQGAKYHNRQNVLPHVLIVIAARFQRVNWLYETIAYAGILKNVGVVFQNMYLVATALGLAPCALGSGNSDFFAAAAGTDYYAETSVGEFILATKPEE